MTVYQFSALSDGEQVPFNPSTDVLNFDSNPAAQVRFATEGSSTRIIVGSKDVVLFNTSALQLATSNMTFADGSRLLFGDNSVGTAGDNGNNIFTGTAGADLFAGFGGNDTLDGGAGNDTFLMSSGTASSYGADKLYGRDGNDTVYFGEYAQSGVTASLVGGTATGGGAAGAGSAGIYFMENLVGGAFNDNLTGDAAANRLEGGAGNDTLTGREGNDTLLGGEGDDRFLMSNGGSSIGNNVIDGGAGSDTVELGSLGKSAVTVDLAAGTMTGGGSTGAESSSLAGIENVVGSAYADRISGNSSNNSLSGFYGNDTLDGAAGNDRLEGGVGADRFLFSAGPGTANADTITDFAVGTDTIALGTGAFANIGPTGDFAAGDERFALASSVREADDRVIYDPSSGNLFYDADGSGAGGQQLIATLANRPALSATDIAVDSTPGAPPGGEVIRGTEGDDTLVGTPGDDTIDGLGGNDSILGIGGNDRLIGGTGNDTIDPGDVSDDTMDGGEGDDTYVDAGFTIRENTVIDAGGIDTAIAESAFYIGLLDVIENLIVPSTFVTTPGPSEGGVGVDGNASNNVIRIESDDVFLINGQGGDDLLIGGPGVNFYGFGGAHGDDTVVGSDAGYDVLQAGDAAVIDFRTGTATTAGGSVSFSNVEEAHGSHQDDRLIANDAGVRLVGEFGSDTLVGGAGNDVLLAGRINPAGVHDDDDDNQLSGGAGNDTLESGHGNDTLEGGSGNDRLSGDEGMDWVDGGIGRDTLSGGGGADGFAFTATPGLANADEITDFDIQIDTILLDGNAHANSGPSGNFVPNDERFASGAGFTSGQELDDRVIYDTNTGNLYYDFNGSNAGGSELIATLAGRPTLAATHFAVFNGSSSGSTIRGTEGNDSLVGTAGTDSMEGLGGNDTLDGLAGADTMDGGTGDDIFIVDNAGDMVIERIGEGAGDEVRSSVSYTLPSFVNNLMLTGTANINGTGNEFANIITGNAGHNTLIGGAGNDRVSGEEGMDWVEGGTGRDTLRGGAGADGFAFTAAPGLANADEISDFDVQIDTILLDGNAHANSGADGNFVPNDERFASGAGFTSGQELDDRVVYDTSTGNLYYDFNGSNAGGSELIATLAGRPTLAATHFAVFNGSGSGSTIRGTEGDDSLVGTPGNDSIEALGGNDTIDGAGGDDTLNGGTGNDSYIGSGYSGRDTIIDAAGVDTAVAMDGSFIELDDGLENLLLPTTYVAPQGIPDIIVEGNAGDNLIRIDAAVDAYIIASGGAGNDTILGGPNRDQISIGEGNDVIDGRGGFDILHFDGTVDMRTMTATTPGGGASFANIEQYSGGEGNDLFIAGDTGANFHGASGNDTLLGGAGSDTMFGGGFPNPLGSGFDQHPGDDVLQGRAGSDRLVGGLGNDTLSGGAGNDTLEGDSAEGPNGADEFVFDVAPGAANADVVRFSTFEARDTLVLDATVMPALGASGAFASGDDRFFAGAGANAGQDQEDRVVYNTTTGQLWYDADGSNAGQALLIATLLDAPSLLATDIVVINGSSTGGSHIVGTEGPDNLVGTSGDDTIDGLGGNDHIVGDPIEGPYGNDVINAGDGDDTINGYGGNDTLRGGAGNDAIVIDSASTDFNFHPGSDVIDGGEGIDSVTFSHEGVSTTAAVTVDLAAGTYRIDDSRGTVNGTITGIEYVGGSALADRITGSAAAETLYGASGEDTLSGGGGDDQLQGGGESDLLMGGDGNDSIIADEGVAFGAPGDDTLDGGAGVDTLNGGDGNDTYIVTAGDTIVNDSGGTDIVFSNASWTLGSTSGLENLTLTGTAAISGQGNNFANVINGNDANNTLNGRAGSDLISGNGGNDTFDMSAGGTASYGNDTIHGGSGFDTVDFVGSAALAGVTIDLGAGTGNAGAAGSFTFSSIERVFGGNFADRLTGSSGSDTFYGQGGNDTLNGAAGNDSLTGGAGNDSFLFANTAGTANADRILDFISGTDELVFENGVLTALGGAGAWAAGDERFVAGAGFTAGREADDRLVYNTSTGNLYYDADGSGAGAAQLVFTLSGSLAASDITVI